jgi:hypothetical protein
VLDVMLEPADVEICGRVGLEDDWFDIAKADNLEWSN